MIDLGMTFEEFEQLISNWYEVDSKDLSIDGDTIPADFHPILREFYRKFGNLAERDTPFKVKDSYEGPFAGQDFIAPLSEVKHENNFTIFGHECQGNFRISASKNTSYLNAYADGDWNFDDSIEGFQNTNIPLQECLITFALKETIASALFFSSGSKKEENTLLRRAASGQKYTSRYIWENEPYTFFLSDEVWCMRLGQQYCFAQKNDWKKPPSKRTIRKKSFLEKIRRNLK